LGGGRVENVLNVNVACDVTRSIDTDTDTDPDPDFLGFPRFSSIPSIPSIQSIQSIQSIPSIPSIPSTPTPIVGGVGFPTIGRCKKTGLLTAPPSKEFEVRAVFYLL
jgi:hypothetical protein